MPGQASGPQRCTVCSWALKLGLPRWANGLAETALPGIVCVSLEWSEGQVVALKMQSLNKPELQRELPQSQPFLRTRACGRRCRKPPGLQKELSESLEMGNDGFQSMHERWWQTRHL